MRDATDARPAFRLAFANSLSDRLSLGYNAGIAWDEEPLTVITGATELLLAQRDAWRIRSVLHFDGLPIDARSVTDEILRQERKGAKVAEGASV